MRCLVPREQSAHLPTFMPVTCPHTNYTCTQHIILLINNSVIIGKQFRTPPHALQYYRNDSFKCFEVIALGSFRNTEIKFPTQSHPATEGRMRRNRKLVWEDNEDISINRVVVAPGQWHCLYGSVQLAIFLTFQVMTVFRKIFHEHNAIETTPSV